MLHNQDIINAIIHGSLSIRNTGRTKSPGELAGQALGVQHSLAVLVGSIHQIYSDVICPTLSW